MPTDVSSAEDFLISAETPGTGRFPDPDAFLQGHRVANRSAIERVPLERLTGWSLGDQLAHRSGRFFTVEGLSVRTDYGPMPQWDQPIIVQPEIGILGLLTKRIDGVQHFLMQAKMEPGNSVPVQYSATVQATPSNYERVHGGSSTPYLQYFLEGDRRRRIIADRLLSEHASWYLFKRNRNTIIEIPSSEEVPMEDNFVWMTLGQLRKQLQRPQRVNMNARTVLSCVSYGAARPGSETSSADEFQAQVIESHRISKSDDDVAAAMTWLIDQKARFHLDVRRKRLRDMTGWISDGEDIRHVDGRFFRIVGLSVLSASREVGTWSQPMLEPAPGNVVAFICQRRFGELEFLVQAAVQPGLTDRLELAPSIQLSPGVHREPEDMPPLAEYLRAPRSLIRRNAVQSEDGGRFANADTAHLVIEVPEDHHLEAPENYRWMSLGLLNRLVSAGYYVNVEARSLMACLL